MSNIIIPQDSSDYTPIVWGDPSGPASPGLSGDPLAQNEIVARTTSKALSHLNPPAAQTQTLSPIKAQLIYLEYREAIGRMLERINTIGDVGIKTKAAQALRLANSSVGFIESQKQLSTLKTLFLQHLPEHQEIAQEIIDYANKYRVIFCHALPGAYHQTIMSIFSEERKMPEYVTVFDIAAKHTIPCKDYLDIRVSKTIRQMINEVNKHGKNTEIFIGSESQLLLFYAKSGLERIAHLKTNGSIQYFLFGNEEDVLSNRIVICGIGNESKLNHLLLQLKFAEVDLSKVVIRGTVDHALHDNQLQLEALISSLPAEIEIIFMGNRFQMLIDFAQKHYPVEMQAAVTLQDKKTIAEQLLKTHHNLVTHSIGGGVYKFSYMEMEFNGKKVGAIGFRMPNGSLARRATEALMRKGVRYFVMVGAGGSLTNKAGIGSLQLIQSAAYNGSTIHLDSLPTQLMDIELTHVPRYESGKNITVDSPLVETVDWLQNAHRDEFTSVDVETYHILTGMHSGRNTPFKILPGIFTSDVLGEHPLTDKIDPSNAWPYLTHVIHECFDYIKKTYTPTV